MKCMRYHGKPGHHGCGRRAMFTVDGTHLCWYHAKKRPLEIVLEDIAKMQRHVHISESAESLKCEYHRGCENSAIYKVEDKSYCREHSEECIYGEALFGELKRVITMADFRDEGDRTDGK